MRSFRSFASDDRHVMAKHASVYPSTEELDAVQTLVSTVESALKRVSDWMDNLNLPPGKPTTTTTTNNKNDSDDSKESTDNTNAGSESDCGTTPPPTHGPESSSVLCGVMRVGLVAKGLLIKGDTDLELVLMCREKPTKLLLYTISANLPLQIQTLTEDKYEVRSQVPEAAILVFNTKDPKLTLKITLSSLAMREEEDHNTSTEQAPQVSVLLCGSLSHL